MRRHLSNAAYGVLDYAAHPAAMLLAAPLMLMHLGFAQYGVWVVATALVSAGAIVASGFGDANIQLVASSRASGDKAALLRVVRSMMAINLALGGALALACWALAPLAANHLVPSDAALRTACLWSLRIASLLVPARAVESVCISTLRAFERYGAAVRISIAGRVLTLVAAVALTLRGRGVVSIMGVTFAVVALGTLAQLFRLRQFLGAPSLLPSFDRHAASALFGFGAFSWLLAVAGVVFSQADRLLLGVSLGAASVAAYALCVQIAQPIYGIAAAALHFLFPCLARLQTITRPGTLRKTVLAAFALNLLLVLPGTSAVLLFGRPLLHAWVGEAVAHAADSLLAPIAWSFALLGLNVTGYYALLALGRVRIVAWVNIAGGAAMLLMMLWLLPRDGVSGVAMARLCYGAATLLLYWPLAQSLRRPCGASSVSLPAPGAYPVCEDA